MSTQIMNGVRVLDLTNVVPSQPCTWPCWVPRLSRLKDPEVVILRVNWVR